MNTNRMAAILVGILYIIGTVTGILSVVFYGGILDDPDYLIKVSANENQIVIGSLLVLTMGFSLALVPVVIFPIFKEYNEALALGYVVFRGGLETVTYIVLVISRLLLIILSQEYVAAGAPDAPYFQALGALLLKGHDSTTSILIIVFSLGALMLYYLFYQSKLIPRWISGWGFVAIILHLATGFLTIFRLITPFSTISIVMDLPIALQEMVMAVWLIAKGFNTSALASDSAKTATNKPLRVA